jgi:hypothetical protein
LAQYRVTYPPDRRQLKMVTTEHLFETPYRSLQLPLWICGGDDWLPVLRLSAYAPRRSPVATVMQPSLFPLKEVGAQETVPGCTV